jgi:hypothetical protein
MRDPVRNHARLARSGACQDEQGAVDVFDRSPLFGVE